MEPAELRMGRGSSPGAKVTLFIPTRNAGPKFPETFRLMSRQDIDRPLEILVIDSGSTDGTVEFLRNQPVRLIEIPRSEFNHGLTRNRAIQEATGEFVVMTVQDARPRDCNWIRKLLECFEDPEVAGAYSRQLPWPDANPLARERLRVWAAASTEARIQCIEDRDAFDGLPPLEKMSRSIFDNVSSCVSRRVALEIPFRRRRFGEDIDWGYRVISAGYKLVFEPGSAVIHSHDRSALYELKRIYLDHQSLYRLFGVHTIPSGGHLLASMRYGIAENRSLIGNARDLSRVRRRLWQGLGVLHALAASLGQYLGARSVGKLDAGSRFAMILDRVLRRGV